MRGPDVYRNILAGIIAYGGVLGCTPRDASVFPSQSDKRPGEMTLRTPSPSSSISLETPPPGWQEYTSLKRWNRLVLRLQLPDDWSIRETDQEILAESKPTRDLTQMASVRILFQLNSFESNTFAEKIAESRSVENKETRSPLKLNVKGKEVLSFIKKNESANQGQGLEEHIFGFTLNGVGVAIIIDAPSNRIQAEKEKFQRMLDTLDPVTLSGR